jgi:hypothetical protein
VEKYVYLSRDVYVASATWQITMRIEAEVGDLVQMIGNDKAQVRYSAIGSSGDALYDRKCWWKQCSPVATVYQWFGLKTTVTISWFSPQNNVDGLVIWASKSPRQFFDLDLKTKVDDLVICASKSPW